jgi:hypothetical protein
VGRLIEERVDELVLRFVDEIRADPSVPSAHGLDRALLEDHYATMLLEIAKAIVMLDRGAGDPEHVRDGDSIRVTIARLHGRQRARLGWEESEVRREHEVLRRVVSDFLRGPGEREAGGEADLGMALSVANRLLERAERLSLEALANTTDRAPSVAGTTQAEG